MVDLHSFALGGIQCASFLAWMPIATTYAVYSSVLVQQTCTCKIFVMVLLCHSSE